MFLEYLVDKHYLTKTEAVSAIMNSMQSSKTFWEFALEFENDVRDQLYALYIDCVKNSKLLENSIKDFPQLMPIFEKYLNILSNPENLPEYQILKSQRWSLKEFAMMFDEYLTVKEQSIHNNLSKARPVNRPVLNNPIELQEISGDDISDRHEMINAEIEAVPDNFAQDNNLFDGTVSPLFVNELKDTFTNSELLNRVSDMRKALTDNNDDFEQGLQEMKGILNRIKYQSEFINEMKIVDIIARANAVIDMLIASKQNMTEHNKEQCLNNLEETLFFLDFSLKSLIANLGLKLFWKDESNIEMYRNQISQLGLIVKIHSEKGRAA